MRKKRQHLERIPVKGIKKNTKSFVARKNQVPALAHFNFFPLLPVYLISMEMSRSGYAIVGKELPTFSNKIPYFHITDLQVYHLYLILNYITKSCRKSIIKIRSFHSSL